MDPRDEHDEQDERSIDDNPGERWQDKVRGIGHVWRFFWLHKLYRDLLLVAITLSVVFAFVSIKDSRVEATKNSCEKSNQQTAAINENSRVLQGQIVAGAALPGDTIDPAGEKNPLKWKTIIPGPLSQSIQEQFPGFPTPEQRLVMAKTRAAALDDKKIEPRDCAAEVAAVKGS